MLKVLLSVVSVVYFYRYVVLCDEVAKDCCKEIPIRVNEGLYSPENGYSKRYFAEFDPSNLPSLVVFAQVDNNFSRISFNLYDDPSGEFNMTKNIPLHIRLRPGENVVRNSYVNGKWLKRPPKGKEHDLLPGSVVSFKVDVEKMDEAYGYKVYINKKLAFSFRERDYFKVMETKYLVIHGDIKVMNVFQCSPEQKLPLSTE